MAYANKSTGQGMQQKSSDKLDRSYGDGHNFISLSILCIEDHFAVIKRLDPTVGNGDPMGVAGNVLEYVIRPFDRLPHTDNPLVSVEFIFKQFVSVAEADFAAFNRTCQKVNELAAEHQRQRLLVKQIVFFTWDPAVTVFRYGTAGDKAVQMKMGVELLVPCM